MTLPAWDFSLGITEMETDSALPQASFEPDFGPNIQRPRTTAFVDIATITVLFHEGDYNAFRTWWATEARGGDFTWCRPDTGEDTIVRPVDGRYSATVLRGRNADTGLNEAVRVTIQAFLLPAPAPE